jgi:hypothetical protein
MSREQNKRNCICGRPSNRKAIVTVYTSGGGPQRRATSSAISLCDECADPDSTNLSQKTRTNLVVAFSHAVRKMKENAPTRRALARQRGA